MSQSQEAAPTPRRLDTRGKLCPLPILMTAKEVLRLEVGERLEVLGDDLAIRDDMPVYCLRAGHKLLVLEEDDQGVVRCLIEKLHDR